MIMDDATYQTFSLGSTPFTMPMNPGAHPKSADKDLIIHEQQVVEHKAEVKEFKSYLRVKNALQIKIKETIDTE